MKRRHFGFRLQRFGFVLLMMWTLGFGWIAPTGCGTVPVKGKEHPSARDSHMYKEGNKWEKAASEFVFGDEQPQKESPWPKEHSTAPDEPFTSPKDTESPDGSTQVEDSPVQDKGVPDRSTPDTRFVETIPEMTHPPKKKGFSLWKQSVQPLLVQKCGKCHLGKRFAFFGLERKGKSFTDRETTANYEAALKLVALDVPTQSRLLAKVLPTQHARAITHAGGSLLKEADAAYKILLQWIQQEKSERCADCGRNAKVQYLAYVDQPSVNWGIARIVNRRDHGYRTGAKIMMQPIDPKTFKPKGAAFSFLPSSFCGPQGACDFGHLAVSHDGKRMAFECRKPLGSESWESVRWNLCVAEINAQGKAVSPRFLFPDRMLNRGETAARSTPYGLANAKNWPLRGRYDKHYRVRWRNDFHPVFSADDKRIYFSSRRPDPRTKTDATRTYHGFEHLNHIIAANILSPSERKAADAEKKLDLRSIYQNEGGTADFPGFLRNGNVVFHTWNLERMDRHLYTQTEADGKELLPVFMGRVQGPNMWGKWTQLANGLMLGMTGARRAVISNYVPFVADHTLGTSANAKFKPFAHLDESLFKEVLPYPNGYCKTPPNGANCRISRFYEDPSYSPDGRSFVTFTPNPFYTMRGSEMFTSYAKGSDLKQRLTSLSPYLPKGMGIYLLDHKGKREAFLRPTSGRMYRYPVWVGRRHPPTKQSWITDESKKTAQLHIADVPLWLSFRTTGSTSKARLMQQLDTIVAVRVMYKEIANNGGLNDGLVYRAAVNNQRHDHPTHLGISNSTGYVRFIVPIALGGDSFGDVKLQADRSVRLQVPAGKLLLIQGIDAKGFVVRQRARIFSLPPGHIHNVSVKRTQYRSQCSSCHGSITNAPFVNLDQTHTIPFKAMEFATQSTKAIDLSHTSVKQLPLTFLHTLRPIIDKKCVSCHSGSKPAGELSLVKEYDPKGNYPAGKWAKTPGLASSSYLSFVPANRRVPSYAYSLSMAWVFRSEQSAYKQYSLYAKGIQSHSPMGALAPWDPAYQNLFATNAQGSPYYLSGHRYLSHVGRSDKLGGYARDGYLMEVLTNDTSVFPGLDYKGRDHSKDLTPVELQAFKAVIDIGFPYMAKCSDKKITTGPNKGKDWCDTGVHRSR